MTPRIYREKDRHQGFTEKKDTLYFCYFLILFSCYDITFWTMRTQNPPFKSLFAELRMWRLRLMQSPDSVILTETEPTIGRTQLGGRVCRNEWWLQQSNTNCRKCLACFNTFNCDIIHSWGNLIRFGLAVPHVLIPLSALNQEECADEFSKSQRNCWLLFEMFVLAISDTKAFPGH